MIKQFHRLDDGVLSFVNKEFGVLYSKPFINLRKMGFCFFNGKIIGLDLFLLFTGVKIRKFKLKGGESAAVLAL